jgi:hypothetical protein
MLNVDKILAHRAAILTAFTVYIKLLEAVKKKEDEAEVETDDTERRIEIMKMLKTEFADQRGMLLEGTPMGDQATVSHFTTDDGTVLTGEVVNELLESVGIDAPLEHIARWTLEQRKVVHAFVKARQIALLDDTEMPAFPNVIDPAWVTDRDMLLEKEMAPEEIDAWLARGPWGVRHTPSVAVAEEDWQIYLPRGARIIEGTTEVRAIGETTQAQTYGQIDRARLIAANLNTIEQGLRVRAGLEPLAGGGSVNEVSEEAPSEESTDAVVEAALAGAGDATPEAEPPAWPEGHRDRVTGLISGPIADDNAPEPVEAPTQ